MKLLVHLYSQSKPMKFKKVINCYTKDGMYCIQLKDYVDKYPVDHIFRVREFNKKDKK